MKGSVNGTQFSENVGDDAQHRPEPSRNLRNALNRTGEVKEERGIDGGGSDLTQFFMKR